MKVASDGASGLDLARSFQPDVVLLDLLLPTMTGIEVMKRLRTDAKLGQVPIIVFSNVYMTSMMHEAHQAGATRCLSKDDCTPRQVIDAVRGALSGNAEVVSPAVSPIELPVVAPAPVPTPGTACALPPQPSTDNTPDTESQEELSCSFLLGIPPALERLRKLLDALVKSDEEAARSKQLKELRWRVHSLAAIAGLAGLSLMAHVAEALEVLLKQLHEEPSAVNASALRTVAASLDFLSLLFDSGVTSAPNDCRPPSVLVVDDEAFSGRAVAQALDIARLKFNNVGTAAAAMKLLSSETFDLVVLDVDMPGVSGFELCARTRALPGHGDTPVVFVSRFDDFNHRATSTLSGGNDCIAQPFLAMELAVKALVHVLRGRVPTQMRPFLPAAGREF